MVYKQTTSFFRPCLAFFPALDVTIMASQQDFHFDPFSTDSQFYLNQKKGMSWPLFILIHWLTLWLKIHHRKNCRRGNLNLCNDGRAVEYLFHPLRVLRQLEVTRLILSPAGQVDYLKMVGKILQNFWLVFCSLQASISLKVNP